MEPNWKKYTEDNWISSLSESYCLYVFYHKKDSGRPWYIGKAKYFGTKQDCGYKANARYNSGYRHLVAGMLHAGFELYIANIGKEDYRNLEGYEQELIHEWNPISHQKRVGAVRKAINHKKPWNKPGIA